MFPTGDDLKDHLDLKTGRNSTGLQLAVDSAIQVLTETVDRRFDNYDQNVVKYFRSLTPHIVEVDDIMNIGTIKTCSTRDGTFTTVTDSYFDYERVLTGEDSPIQYIESTVYSHYFEEWVEITPPTGGYWGWGTVPSCLRNAILIQAARWYQRKSSPSGVVSSFSGTGLHNIATAVDDDVKLMLKPVMRREDLVAR